MSGAPSHDWTWTDEPCPYRDGPCSMPIRTHYHLNTRPGGHIIVVYYDESPEQAEIRHNAEQASSV